MPAVNTDADSVEQQTILGSRRTNPYTIANMRQAYNNLGYSALPVTATNLYVRFLPNSVDQLSVLDSALDAQSLEMFDAPMDYDVLQEGDYYQDPSIPDTSITWQYAVVPTNFQPPSGITYQILSQIHIPGDDYTAMETEAERLASIQDSINCSGGMQPQSGSSQVTPNCAACGGGCSIAGPIQVDPGGTYTYYLNCADGSLAYSWNVSCGTTNEWTDNQIIVRWNSSGCTSGTITANGADGTILARLSVTIAPSSPPPPPPPPPAPDAQIPAGTITVSDVNLGSTPFVRNVRVIAKRWFTIRRTYTDNNGHFQFATRFKHKVKIRVKFKNDYCNIRGIRGVRLWQTIYAVQNTLGVYSGDKSNITYNYTRYNTKSTAKGNRYWAAATTINAIQEHRDYAAQFGFSAPPLGLNIYLTNWGLLSGLASTPLFAKRPVNNASASFINTFLVGTSSSPIYLVNWYAVYFAGQRSRIDMAIDYQTTYIADLTSDFIKGTIYHEASHASQYSYVGNDWYTNFVMAELAEIAAHPNPNDAYNPYGNGTTSNSPIIALGEAWSYHIGHFLADQRYGVNASCQIEQNGSPYYYCNYNFTGHPHIDVLENFIPNLQSDPFKWIPKGLMYDLIDNAENFTVTGVNDQVSGYTIQQIFSALQSNVSTIAQYKARLLSQNPTNPTNTYLNSLFTSYGY